MSKIITLYGFKFHHFKNGSHEVWVKDLGSERERRVELYFSRKKKNYSRKGVNTILKKIGCSKENFIQWIQNGKKQGNTLDI